MQKMMAKIIRVSKAMIPTNKGLFVAQSKLSFAPNPTGAVAATCAATGVLIKFNYKTVEFRKANKSYAN